MTDQATEYVYFMQAAGDSGPIKIGVSWNPGRRYAQILNTIPLPVRILGVVPFRRWKSADGKPANRVRRSVIQKKPVNTVAVPVIQPYQNAARGRRPSMAASHSAQATNPSHQTS